MTRKTIVATLIALASVAPQAMAQSKTPEQVRAEARRQQEAARDLQLQAAREQEKVAEEARRMQEAARKTAEQAAKTAAQIAIRIATKK